MATFTECRPDERLVGRLEPRVVRASFCKPHPIGSPLPMIGAVADPVKGRFSTSMGSVFRKGQTVQLSWVSFSRVSDGAPALVDWLRANVRHGSQIQRCFRRNVRDGRGTVTCTAAVGADDLFWLS
jgi:hypothetical protein